MQHAVITSPVNVNDAFSVLLLGAFTSPALISRLTLMHDVSADEVIACIQPRLPEPDKALSCL